MFLKMQIGLGAFSSWEGHAISTFYKMRVFYILFYFMKPLKAFPMKLNAHVYHLGTLSWYLPNACLSVLIRWYSPLARKYIKTIF